MRHDVLFLMIPLSFFGTRIIVAVRRELTQRKSVNQVAGREEKQA